MSWLDLSSKIDAFKRELDGIDEAISHAMQERAALQAQAQQLAAERSSLAKEQKQLATDLCHLEAQVQSHQLVTEARAKRDANHAATVQQLQADISKAREQLQQDAQAFLSDTADFQAKYSLDALEGRKVAIQADLVSCTAEREAADEEYSRIHAAQQALQRRVPERQAEIRQLRNALEGTKDGIGSESHRQQKLNAELDKLKAPSQASTPGLNGSAGNAALQAQQVASILGAHQTAQQRIATKGKELAQLQRTIAALSTPPRPQNQQQRQRQQQGQSQKPPEWAELYDLYSSPDGGSSGSAQSGKQLGVFERGKQRQRTQQYTVEEPPSPGAPDAQPAAPARQPVPQRPRVGCLVEEMSVMRTTTPVKRKINGAGARLPDWQHEETVTVRRVRRMPAAEAQQHIGGDGGISVSSGPGIRTVLLHETHEAFGFGGTAGAAPALRDLGQTAPWRNGAAASGELTNGQQQRQQSQQGRGTSRQRQGAQGQPKRAPLNVQTRGSGGGGGGGCGASLSEHGTGHGAARGRGGAAHDSGSRAGGGGVAGGGGGGRGGGRQSGRAPRPTMRRMYGDVNSADLPPLPPPPDPDAGLLVDF